MQPASKLFGRQSLAATVAVAVAYALLHFAGAADGVASVRTMAFMLLLLGTVTIMAKLGAKPEGEDAIVARTGTLLTLATATTASCFAATHASGNPIWLACGFLLGIAYGVYALTKNIDDYVAPSFLLFSTLAQAAVVFLLIG